MYTIFANKCWRWPVHVQFITKFCDPGFKVIYTPPKNKLLACTTWILKNRGVTFFGQCSQLLSLGSRHSSAPSGHFKICKWKGEEFLFLGECIHCMSEAQAESWKCVHTWPRVWDSMCAFSAGLTKRWLCILSKTAFIEQLLPWQNTYTLFSTQQNNNCMNLCFSG